ncbi:MAG: ABC transporter ATP-binding protein [Gammaproteobacteria bacterium]|nr:ABC transporter ATP-binding protein [Gammaproteobacteria bacterium]
MIQIHDVGKTYHTGKIDFEALRNINLEIEKGDYVAILGPSGSGKSTLMHIIGCLATPTVGSYFLAGKEVSKFTSNDLAKARNLYIGFVFQKFNLMPQMTVLDNVSLPLLYRGIKTEERRSKAKEVLEQLGLASHLMHRSNELSGGQQQRVAVARALVTNPEVILADEPTGNLDSKSGEGVINLFNQLHEGGKTVILVTHDTAVAKNANRIIQIQDGTIRV